MAVFDNIPDLTRKEMQNSINRDNLELSKLKEDTIYFEEGKGYIKKDNGTIDEYNINGKYCITKFA